MASVVAFANHKGGCAKTTSTVNIGCALGLLGCRVLLVDCDPQANLGEALGVDADRAGARLEDAIERLPAGVTPWTARAPGAPPFAGGVHLLPCSERLEEVVSRRRDPQMAYAVGEIVFALGAGYDFVLLDTPPGLGPLSSMALLAADWVIVPARPADFDVGGAVKVAELVEATLASANPRLRMLGVLICQSQRRWTLRADTLAALEEAGLPRLRQEIPFMVRVGGAPRHGAPTVALEPDSLAGAAYRAVAHDLLAALAAAA